MSTSAGPETEDDSYLGYSLALGDFTGSRLRAGLTGSRYKRTKGSDLAVGMPRGANLTGKVISCKNLFKRKKIKDFSFVGKRSCFVVDNHTSLWSKEFLCQA